MKEVHLHAKLADLQEVDYHNTLVLHSMIAVMIDKGFFTQDELTRKMNELDSQLTFQIETYTRISDALLSRTNPDKPITFNRNV
ncbi:hypothetical protein EDM52_13490 [Brevibacillus invocatus]|uniref:Nitrile hydratase subunit beta n=1 Tax=Brevibacillus invocatus TaxID=173959 RepID=A0A3M8CB58_9BACL|nr:hypothetical protein [Brevibacillus invocatus]RNB72761.1 hypothetical protein EDM52_13490 [Brevibacillus invocatus]